MPNARCCNSGQCKGSRDQEKQRGVVPKLSWEVSRWAQGLLINSLQAASTAHCQHWHLAHWSWKQDNVFWVLLLFRDKVSLGRLGWPDNPTVSTCKITAPFNHRDPFKTQESPSPGCQVRWPTKDWVKHLLCQTTGLWCNCRSKWAQSYLLDTVCTEYLQETEAAYQQFQDTVINGFIMSVTQLLLSVGPEQKLWLHVQLHLFVHALVVISCVWHIPFPLPSMFIISFTFLHHVPLLNNSGLSLFFCV